MLATTAKAPIASSPNHSSPLLTLKNLTLGYDHHPVLKNLSLTINSGDFVCIVGPNGAGKTTLVRGILGLLRPLSGQITFAGNLSPKFIGYMPQETSTDPHFPASVLEIVLSGTLNQPRPLYHSFAKAAALQNLQLLRIDTLKDRSFSDLSGGQRQKVLLARALSATTQLLILDEPSNNLDQKSKTSLYSLVQQLNREQGITVIMVTHDLDHGNLIGNKILSLRDQDFFFGSTASFIRKVHHE